MDWKDWDELRYVLALGRAGSMTDAASVLGSSAATVSRKVKSASSSFGQPLFRRQKNGWKLTSAGSELFEVANQIEAMLSSLNIERESNALQKPVKLTTLDFLVRSVLSPNLSKLREHCPQLEVTLHSSNKNLSLAYGEADVAVRMARPKTGRLVSRKLGEFRYSIYGMLEGDHTNWIGREEHLNWVPEISMANDHFGRPPFIRVADYKSALDAMKSMQIATVLPEAMVQNDSVVVPVPGAPEIWRQAWLVVHEDRKNEPSIRSVIDWLDDCFKPFQRRREPT